MSSRYFFHGGVSSRGSTIQGGGNVNLTSTQGDIQVVQGNLSALSGGGRAGGGAAGGDLAQIAISMEISRNAVENNRLLNIVELTRIKGLSNGDVVLELCLRPAAGWHSTPDL
ncbi:VENN motif pre-toxin domain-containing protein [Stenotrophomonas sp. TD3]|uniref:VENN motif pre-toxin domain-containing protein n=1 Tax=Stenotrophomonas sp. TD3 TaxID=1641707 RepID=UPI001F0A4144|nr:VENN motif pre-toxin domain-containing protein [Stenotrophomonas sp. TD3]